MRIMLAAEDAAGIQALKAIDERGYEIAGVMAQPGGDKRQGASVWEVATAAGHPTWPAERLADPGFGDVFRDNDVGLFLNVYSLHIVHEEVLKAPRLGSFNLHPGPLPAYAGLNSVSWAIYNGERSHGVTLHRMEPVVDSGAIAYQEIFPIDETDSGLAVSTRCVRTGLELVIRLVMTIDRDSAAVPSLEQDLTARSFYGAAAPHGGRLSWRDSAASVVNYIRACDYYPLSSPWDLPRGNLAGRELAVAKASRTHERSDEPPGSIRRTGGPSVLVACADEWVSIDEVRVGGRRSAAADALEQMVVNDGDSR